MKVSKALLDVWDMKKVAYEETKQLEGAPYFEYIHARVQDLLPAGIRLDIVPAPRQTHRVAAPAAQVAEAAAVYRVQKIRKTAKR